MTLHYLQLSRFRYEESHFVHLVLCAVGVDLDYERHESGESDSVCR